MFTHQKLNFSGSVPEPTNATEEDRKNQLRALREECCFSIINRGTLWYNMLTQSQLNDLTNWYISWLNVTETMVIPKRPDWLNNTLEGEDYIW